MADNFDSNIARRKPDTKRSRPTHPWDISPVPPQSPGDKDNKESLSENIDNPVTQESLPDTVISEPEGVISEPEKVEIDEPNITETIYNRPVENIEHIKGVISKIDVVHENVSNEPSEPDVMLPEQRVNQIFPPKKTQIQHRQTSNDLSDTININSNFFKLHNDVSDHLFKNLSPSAQSVYLRLYRQSYGWNRNWAAESLPKLTSSCNLSLQTVRKAIKELESYGCIRKQFNDYHKATVYRIYLPNEIGITGFIGVNVANANNRGLNINMPSSEDLMPEVRNADSGDFSIQNADGDRVYNVHDNNLHTDNVFSGGQEIDIQSVFFSGTSIYTLLKSGGPLSKDIYKYMSNIHLHEAVSIIDEFYQSIGFSIVSRSLYRKSLLDYFEIIGSGFSSDDIRYAVRWTFKNSKSRPESFSLIKHTMHLAMDDFIKSLKGISGEKALAEEKQKALQRQKEWESKIIPEKFTESDLNEWNSVSEDLRESLNIRSFSAFIEPLKLVSREEGKIVLSSPPDSVSWVNDHFIEKIKESYFRVSGKEIEIEVI